MKTFKLLAAAAILAALSFGSVACTPDCDVDPNAYHCN